jgi:aminoglycoside phosphotransferase (APT) family kinase protein
MHADEPGISPGLVRRLIEAQFPQWAGIGIEAAGPAGTSNAMFRLGPDLAVRLPRRPGAAADIDKEHLWLPRLAPVLPAAVPVPVAIGRPGAGYPWRWSVYRWLDGENPAIAHPGQPELLAEDLAAFASALHRVSPAGAPPSYRCEPLSERDAATRAAIEQVHGLVDAAAVTAAWEGALTAHGPAGRPVWIHADLQPGNLLTTASGRLTAVIDFECAGLGDPAVDLIAAWYVLPAGRARTAFRAAASEAEWARGRGWALSIALLELSYYRNRNPRMANIARHVINEILAELLAPGPARRSLHGPELRPSWHAEADILRHGFVRG